MSIYSKEDLRRPGDYRSASLAASPPTRTPFTHDTSSEYGRIVHSMAFRRLQGKMQLFPPDESPLLRNRLTHSLEVADIAANIAKAINDRAPSKDYLIDGSIVATAALAHDLGHPPFGHSGESALNKFMCGYGGFEGNAQTLRIITRLENRLVEEFPRRSLHFEAVYKDPLGLNLCYRTIAATIKYDNVIPLDSASPTPIKGYYQSDRAIVDSTKRHVLGRGNEHLRLKTIENQIMDIADDIAYSTFDLEDCMLSGLISPIDLMSIEDEVLVEIRRKVNAKLATYGYKYELNDTEIVTIVYKLFDDITRPSYSGRYAFDSAFDRTRYVGFTYRESKIISESSLHRRRVAEILINSAIEGISIEAWNKQQPALTEIKIRTSSMLFIEVLKAYNYIMVIRSPRLQITQKRAFEIIGKICHVLDEDEDDTLLPLWAREQLKYAKNEGDVAFDEYTRNFNPKNKADLLTPSVKRRRFLCDFVAGLTDSEAIDLYSKIVSTDRSTVFGISLKQ